MPLRIRTIALLAPSVLALAACGGSGETLAPGGVSADEAAALNDAAAMLDDNSVAAAAAGTNVSGDDEP